MSTVTIRCLCRRVDHQVKLSAESLPVEVAICHCETCRKTSGVLFTSYLAVTEPPTFLRQLTEYQLSEKRSQYFCSKCGAQVAARSTCNCLDGFSIALGLVQHSENVARISRQVNTASTLDGGLSTFLQIADDPQTSKSISSGTLPSPWNTLGSTSSCSREAEKTLPARCHCGRVEYYVTRPNIHSTDVFSPWPDLLVPYHSGSSENMYDVKWWLREAQTKYLAGTCACGSCRMGAGFPIQCWAFIPKCNIRSLDGCLFDFRNGSLQQYESSPGIFREFCGGCGAVVFWHCNQRPKLIDVSVGLLSARSGAKAEDWLVWHKHRVSFIEEATDRELAKILEKGMQEHLEDNDRNDVI